MRRHSPMPTDSFVPNVIGSALRDNRAMEYEAFVARHLDGVLRLCRAEGWPSFPADSSRALAVLTAPGVVTVVAVEGERVLGFAQVLTDGAIQAYLCNIAVALERRRQGVGRRLVQEVFAQSGAERLDLISVSAADDFYQGFQHRTFPGFRIYPERLDSN